jgi:hypothetical protein
VILYSAYDVICIKVLTKEYDLCYTTFDRAASASVYMVIMFDMRTMGPIEDPAGSSIFF